ncbi:MAG: hypothetical protein AAF607_02245 [Pseudomonadota bacterium]
MDGAGPNETYAVFVYIVMACLALEAALLLILWRVRGIGLHPAQTLAFLGAGASFTGALLVLIMGGSIALLGACLSGAFLCHVFDIVLRWKK